MKERLLCRGKDMYGKWHTGYYRTHPNGNGVIIMEAKKGFTGLMGFIDYEVVPETVGQYAGSKDEHGRMIFEGDICRDDNSYDADGCFEIGIVKWDNNTASFYFMMLPHTNGLNFDEANPEKFMTILGNIHDNPELLEEK